MNADHLKAIGPEIRLSYEKMRDDKKSAYALVYEDPKFAYENQKF